MNYAPIHNHTMYSSLDGLSTPLEIAQRCQCIGCTSAGIMDHGTVAGHLEFDKVMRANGIKPIFGVEFYHGVKTEFGKNERDQAHFVAGAMTDEGLRNIWRMVDAASNPNNYRFVGRVNFDICDRFKEGVFATSACIQGLVSQSILKDNFSIDALSRYIEIYRDDFYIEIHTYPGEEHERLNGELVMLAQERGVPLIYATDAHFADPSQYEIHDAYVAMQTGDNILMPIEKRKMWHPKSLYIQDEDQIRESLSYLPDRILDEALRNSYDLAEKCDAHLPEVKRHIPIFVPKDCPWVEGEESAAMMFIRLIEEGIEWRYGEASDEIWEKAAYEIEVMLDAGLEHYFLQVWDLCEFCNQEGITRGPGRGSSAGSIISYALGITDIDPIRYDLIFERFWNPGRAKGFPDIDLDFPVNQRKKVRGYLMKRWGHDKVRPIGNTIRMKPKAVLDKTQKACGVTWDEKEALKKIIGGVPDIDIHDSHTIGWAKESDPGKAIYVMDHVGKQIIEWLEQQPDERIDHLIRWLEIVETVCGRPSGYGVHASGVVVSDVPLADQLPCMYNKTQDIQVTCFPMSDVDKLGFLKDDLLGIRNLDTLERWEELIGEKMDWHALAYEEHPEEMWQMLDNGLTMGVFQIEKGYARQLCKEMKPRSIDDLGVIVAINRPGPIRAKVPDSYMKRRNGEEEVTYDHPILEPILDDTYGLLVYQEQIMRYFAAIGYNEGDTDEIRKILGKKKPEVMATVYRGTEEWEGKGYMQTAMEAGLDEKTAQLIWDKVEGFASYSFNKSHAIAYATLAFRTVYAKWRDKHKMIIALIETNPEDAGDYVSEGRRMDIYVKPPHIQKSGWDISTLDGDIYFGFSNIKGIGKGSAQYIVELRNKYWICTPDDFKLALTKEQEIWEEQRHTPRSPRQRLGSNKIEVLETVGAFEATCEITRDLPLAQVQAIEKELLQVVLTDNNEEIFAFNSERLEDCDSYSDLELRYDVFDIPGIIASVEEKHTRKDNKPMGIVTIEYQGDQAEFVVFPREWKNYKFLWKERTPAIFTLTRTERGIHFDQGVKLDG